MQNVYCNPLNLSYRYQHIKSFGRWIYHREGADPTLILFKSKYYMFVSMSAGFWHSDDLVNWQFHENRDLLIYDYAPDVRQVGEYLYFCASRRAENCPILRTLDPLSDSFEQVSAPFPFWDPGLFCDDDGRVYLYWGCSATEPIYGVELDRHSMTPIGEKVPLFIGDPVNHGFERPGENCDPDTKKGLVSMIFGGKPFTEGAFMTKYNGQYYLQYAIPGTEHNTYADGVYISKNPLGPFEFCAHNPFSSNPGGFITAAGHGSTIQDKYGNWWHASTMRISVNKNFERRVGLFPAGFDKDGVIFCNQNFADYPIAFPEGKFDPWQIEPKWMLLSYKKPVKVSSNHKAHQAELAVDEDIRTWWSAATNKPGEYIELDLGDIQIVHAIQVNIADGEVRGPKHSKEDMHNEIIGRRFIDSSPQHTRYVLEGSLDGSAWFILEDKRNDDCDLPHDFFVYEGGNEIRYIKITGYEFPYGQTFKVSGLRVFGMGKGEKPARVEATASRTGDLDALIQWEKVTNAQGYNIRYGVQPEKLYLSWLVYDQDHLNLPTLNKGATYYVCVDSFNENGITTGTTVEIKCQ